MPLIPDHTKSKNYRPLELMFNQIPGRYDLLNRIITLGQDEGWRKHAARACLAEKSECILDLCTGTGDLALQMAKRSNGSVRIHALDYSEPMLAAARYKAGKKHYDCIEFIRGDAADLPYASGSLDSVGIAFAFRNLTYKNPDRDKFLAEIFRVLKYGGRFIIVESSRPSNRFYKTIFDIYLELVVAKFGGIISRHRSAYRYLAASAKNFYNPPEVSDMLIKTGFSEVRYKPFMGGVAGITIARK